MKKTKALVMSALLMLTMFAAAMPLAVSAQTIATSEKQVLSFAEKHGVEVFVEDSIDNTRLSANSPRLKLTIDEFELLIESIAEAPEEFVVDAIPISAPSLYISQQKQSVSKASSGQDSYTWSQWAYFDPKILNLFPLPSLTVFKNITVSFDYGWDSQNRAIFVSERNISSWLSGIVILQGWTQTGSSFNTAQTNYPNDTMRVSVTGYAYIGVEVDGMLMSVLYPTTTWSFGIYYMP